MTMLSVHGHVIPGPSHIIFVGRNTKMKALVVIFRQGRKAYVYKLGDSYHQRLCCNIAKLPNPGVYLNKYIKPFPVEDYA